MNNKTLHYQFLCVNTYHHAVVSVTSIPLIIIMIFTALTKECYFEKCSKTQVIHQKHNEKITPSTGKLTLQTLLTGNTLREHRTEGT